MSFHLSLPVRDLEESRKFFVDVLRATVTRSESAYVNFDLDGAQVTLHEKKDMPPPSAHMHYGVNLPVDEFLELARHIQETAAECISVQPRVVEAGTPRERHKMFLRCPSGYTLEIKGVQS